MQKTINTLKTDTGSRFALIESVEAAKSGDRQRREQLAYKLDFKRLCFDRAIEAADYYQANIFAAQIEWYEAQLQ